MQMVNCYYSFFKRTNARENRLSVLTCFPLLVFVLLVFTLLATGSKAAAMQRHHVYEAGGTLTTVSDQGYPVTEEQGVKEGTGILKHYQERPHHRMGSGVSIRGLYRSNETVPRTTEATVNVPPREEEHGMEQGGGQEAVTRSEHGSSPGVAGSPRTEAGEQKVAPAEKRKHEAGIERIKAHEGKEHEVEISPIPGVTFVETFINLLDHEINGRFLGWRPNDIIIGKFTDNINNFQLGLLEAARVTAVRLKESLSRLGEADAYDQDLQMALNLLMNKSTQFWFPSAESSYNEALKHLRNYLKKLKTGKAHFYYRVDTLIALVSSYRDFLGNCTNTLVKDREKDGSPVSWFKADDYFYYSQGAAYLIYNILKVVQVGFHEQLVTIDAVDIMEEAIHELHRGVSMSPWIVLDRPLDSIFANHRANLGAVLGEAAHLLSVMTQL